MRNDDIPSINQVVPGALVIHRYTPEIGVVLRVSWNMVEVLLGNSTVRWEMDGFRSTYRNLQ
jgi:hypothetical protein